MKFNNQYVAFYVPRVSAKANRREMDYPGSNPFSIVTKNEVHQEVHFIFGPPEGIRTPALQNRNLLRYPTAPRTDEYIVIPRERE